MTQPRTQKTRRFLILLAGAALVLSLGGHKPNHGGPPPDPDPDPPPAACDGLTNSFDLDQDGLPDLIDCEGLQTGNGAEFDYPGCAVDSSAIPHCTDHTLADVFAEVHKDTVSTGESAFVELSISDDEIFSFAEASLALNIHVVDPGTLGPDRRVLTYSGPNGPLTQAGVILIEDRSFGGSTCPSIPGSTGFSFLSNPNESGTFKVLPQRIIDQIVCRGGTFPNDEMRQFLLNTCSHEFGHGAVRQAPDPDSYHQETLGDCLMEASIEKAKGGPNAGLEIPTAFCANSQATILAGATTQGPTICGDVSIFDGDDPTKAPFVADLFDCLPASAP